MQEKRRKKRRKRSKRRRQQRMLTRLCLVFIGLVVFILLLIGNNYYKKHFIRGTYINEIDVSDMDVTQLESEMRTYQLAVTERTPDGNQATEIITGDQIGVTVSDVGRLQEILKSQNVLKAIFRMIGKREKRYDVPNLYCYADEALDTAIGKLQGFQADFAHPPTDASMSAYDPQTGYYIIPETEGNLLKEAMTKALIRDAVDALLPAIDLEAEGCYEKPLIYADDERLAALFPQLKKYTDVVITYHFGDEEVRIDGTVIDGWLEIDEDSFIVSLKKEAVDDFVVSLRKKYDSIFRDRTFHTSYGTDITVSGGDYGWWMDYGEEQRQLYDMIEEGRSGERTPVYHQTAAAYGERDYGNTYVEVNLTAQHLFVYVDGKREMESDFVSGNERRNFHTPEGIYGITYKEQDAMLIGEDYETPVSFWMPFNGNIGLHDAIWRDEFGADVYKTSGSHGCVNLPYPAAKRIYGLVAKGTPVICYHLPDTERAETTPQDVVQKAQSVIDAIDKIGEVTKDSEKKILRARQLYGEVSASSRQYVSNYEKLTAAEARYREIKKK